MGHYCRICGRTRSNEKFSGKGHKNHVCKDCSGKSGKKAEERILKEDKQAVDDFVSLFGVLVDSEQTSFDDSWFYEREFEISGSDDEDDEGEFAIDGSDDEDDEGEFAIVGIEGDDSDYEGIDDGYEDIPF